MTITDSARRLALVAVVAMLAALLPLSGAFAQDPPAEGDREAVDLDGDTNVDYALRWSQLVYPNAAVDAGNGPTEALIARDDVFADSLASGSLQGADDAGRPLLLTPSDALSEAVSAELERLGVDSVTILGNEDAVSQDVVDELEADYTVNRLGGETRIETAIEVADTVDSDTAILARGFANDDPTQAFADSLAAGGWAAEDNVPVLFTQTEVLTGNTRDHIAEAGYSNIIIVGGELAISSDVEAELTDSGVTVERIAGDNRFETAVAIAEARGYENPDTAEGIILVDGQGADSWADGFPAANLSGQGWPIVLSNSADDELPGATVEYLERSDEGDAAPAFAAHLGDVVLVCGSTVPDGDGTSQSDQCQQAADLLGATVTDFTPPGDSNVTVDVTEVEAGGDIIVTVADAQPGDEIVISGCGVDETITISEDHEGDAEITVTIPADQAEGDCELSVLVNDEEQGPFTITVTAAPSNQTLNVTPTETAVNTVSEAAGTNANRGARTYTVTGLDNAASYDIELHEAEDVVVDDAGNVTFRNSAPATDGATLESVNGAQVGTAGGTEVREIHNVSPVNGQITFTIDSDEADRVIPVVNADTDADNTLDLEAGATATAPKAPTEPFGVGGEKEFIPAEATAADFTGAADDLTIVRVNKDANYVLVDTNDADTVANFTVYYDANDQFRLASGTLVAGNAGDTQTCNPVSMTTWENNLSTGDELDLSSIYAPDEEASSTLCLEDLTPTAMTGVTATAVDEDTIEVTFAAASANASEIRVYRKSGVCSGTLTDYTLVATLPRSATSYTDNGLNPAQQYCYVVTQVVDGDESAISNQDDATTTAAGATAAPQSTDAYLRTDATFQGELSDGDVFRVIFDKVMDPIAEGDTIRLQDAEGETFDFVCSADATIGAGQNGRCQFNTADVTIAGTTYPAGRVLTVTASGTFIDTVAGGSQRYEYPLTITNQSGITDTANRAWTPTDDPDNVVDNEGTKTESGTFGDNTAPTVTAAAESGADDVQLTWDEAVNGLDATAVKLVANGDTCADAAVVTGTGFLSDDGDAVLIVETDGAVAAGTYDLCVGAGTAEDLSGNDNAQQLFQDVVFT